MADEWIPDFVFDAKHPLGKAVNIFLNGELVERPMEARISLASFDGEAFGELIVDARHSLTMINKPRLGEFDYQGIWVKLVCGRVRVEVTNKATFAFFKDHNLLTDPRA